MVVDRLVLELNEYEIKQFASSSHAELRNVLLEVNVRALLLGRVMGEEFLKEDMATVKKLKAKLAETTSSLNSALTANTTLGLENEASKEKILQLKKMVESLKADNDLLQEKCHAAQEKEKTVACRVDVLREDVADLGQKMAKLTLALE